MNLHHVKRTKSIKPGDIAVVTSDFDDGCVICDNLGGVVGWAIKGDMFLIVAAVNERAYVLSFANGHYPSSMGWINTNMIWNITDQL